MVSLLPCLSTSLVLIPELLPSAACCVNWGGLVPKYLVPPSVSSTFGGYGSHSSGVQQRLFGSLGKARGQNGLATFAVLLTCHSDAAFYKPLGYAKSTLWGTWCGSPSTPAELVGILY